MRSLVLALFLSLFLRAVSAQPYVFYQENKIVVQTLDSPAVHIDSFAADEKEKHSVNIHFAKNPGWDFSVQLKKIIVNPPTSSAKSKILFLSDIEGEFDLFRQLLVANNIMDEKYNWIFGKNQLVICGDLFDRGEQVTEELWLLYKLETDAAANGGEVHVLLGNHDIMNMGGDWRYVSPVYAAHAKILGKNYGQLFDDNTELGKWLRSKNIIEKIGNYLCMHGGFSREMLNLQLSVKELNSKIRPWYSLQDSVPQKLDIFFSDYTLFWYRGYFFPPLAPASLIDSTLDYYNVRKIIVGHTIHNMVGAFYEGKVIGIDTDWHTGNAQGLLLEERKFYKINLQGTKQELGNS